MPEDLRKDTRGSSTRMVGCLCAAVLAGACALTPAPAVAAEPAGALPGTPRGSTSETPAPGNGSTSAVTATLSNLTTLTRWAYPQAAAAARRSPSAHARVVGHLRFLTVDGQANVYLALRSYTLNGREWIEVPLPGRPNGRIGWVPAGALGELQVTHQYLRVDRRTTRMTLYRDGLAVWNAPVGLGRPGLSTPAGRFYVTEKLQTIGGPVYGPYALGTSAYAPTLAEWPGGGVVGIHGTDEPQLVPGYPSHGCIRLHNADIVQLYRMVEVGTPIEIV